MKFNKIPSSININDESMIHEIIKCLIDYRNLEYNVENDPYNFSNMIDEYHDISRIETFENIRDYIPDYIEYVSDAYNAPPLMLPRDVVVSRINAEIDYYIDNV